MAVGRVVLHEPRVKVDRMIADDPQAELRRLEDALTRLHEAVDRMLDSSELDLTGESREVIEAYRLFAQDQGWRQKLRDAVRTGLTAEAAVERVQDELRLRVVRAGDTFLRDRLHDFEDLARRLQRQLQGEHTQRDLPKDSVLVARAMGPAELLDYGRDNLCALVLEEVAAASHVAIVARSMRLPLVSSVEGVVDQARAGDLIAVDGETGEAQLRPPEEVVTAFEARRVLRDQRVARIAAVRDLPAVTRDGVHVRLMMNAGLLLDMPHLKESGADGIGLFRTELQFMIGEAMPRLADQTQFYRRIIESAEDQPVVFRTLDLGGDKILPYGRWEREENPALGWRAIRIALDRPALLRYQIRALLAASAGKVLRLLLPMISNVAEFNSARALIDRELERARLLELPLPRQTLVGAMLEVPALMFMLPQILRSADFVSIGSNDLLQFVFAVDRTNPRVAKRYDALNPACADAHPPDRPQRRRGQRRSLALRRNGRPAARSHGADRPGFADALHASGQYRPGEDDDPQHRHARSGAVRGQVVRTDRPQPSYTACGFRRRAGCCDQIGGMPSNVPSELAFASPAILQF